MVNSEVVDKVDRLRILVIAPSYKPAYIYGGPIFSIGRLCEYLVAIGHAVEVFTTNANGESDLDVPLQRAIDVEGVSVTYFPRITGDNTNFSPRLLWALARRAKTFDAIHINYWWNLVSVPSTLICVLLRIRPIVSPRGSLTDYTLSTGRKFAKRLLHTWIGRWILSRVTLHFTTRLEHDQASRLADTSGSQVIPNILELTPDRREERTEGVPFGVLFLGRVDPVKHIELILKAFEEPFAFDTDLLIAGDGDAEYVNRLKELSAGNDHVRWHGFVTQQAKEGLFAATDVLVMPSFTENFGNAAFEALSRGIPVLISEGVGMKDLVSQYNLGRVLGPNVEEWRRAIEEVYLDKAFRVDMRIRAPEILRTVLGPETLGRQYQDMYRGNYTTLRYNL